MKAFITICKRCHVFDTSLIVDGIGFVYIQLSKIEFLIRILVSCITLAFNHDFLIYISHFQLVFVINTSYIRETLKLYLLIKSCHTFLQNCDIFFEINI